MTKSIADIVKELLIDRQAPIISALDLQAMLLGIYAGIHPGSHQSRTRKQNPSESDISRAIQRLENARVVRRDPDFKGTHYQVFDVLEQSAEVVCCLVDPFIWVSHLSAMQLQGLTDRNPAALVLTRPDSQTWRQTAETLENRHPLNKTQGPCGSHDMASLRRSETALSSFMKPDTRVGGRGLVATSVWRHMAKHFLIWSSGQHGAVASVMSLKPGKERQKCT